MWQWFKEIKKKQREERLRRERQWRVIIANDIGLWHPLRYRPVELWDKWAEMQVKVLSHIQQNLPEIHTYIRLHTYYPEIYMDTLKSVPFKTITPAKKDKKMSR